MKIQIFLILLITTTIFATLADQNLIETTCKNTPNYHLCTTTLRADPVSASADVAGLGLIMVDAVKAKTKEVLSAIEKLAGSGQPEALRRCAEVYNAVLKADVPMAVAALTKGDPKFGEEGMADAAVEANTCDGAFGGVAPPPFRGLNDDVRDLAGVARAIIRNLL